MTRISTTVRALLLVLPLVALGTPGAASAQKASVCGPVTYDKGLSTTQTKFSTESLSWGYGAYDPGNPFFYPPSKWYGSESLAAEYAIPFEILGTGFRDSSYNEDTGEITMGGCNTYCETTQADFCLWRGFWSPASNPSPMHACTALKMADGYSKSAIRHPNSPVIIGIPGGDGPGIEEYKFGGNGYSVCQPGQISGPTAQIVAVPSAVQFGQSSSLQYKCTKSTSAKITAAGDSIGSISQMQGARTVTPTADTTYTLTCTGPEGTATASTRVSVWTLPTQNMNLTAMMVTPLNGVLDFTTLGFSIPLNVATVFQSLIVTQGGYQVPAGVTHSFERKNATNNPVGTDVTPSFGGAYNSSQIEFSHTFTSPGVYYLRACADSLNRVAEDQEADNCGPWSEMRVGLDVDGGSVSCAVSDTTILPGESVTYTATPSDGARAPYSWLAADGATGFGTGKTVTRTLASAGSYGMQVSATGAVDAANCPVVTVATAPPPVCPGTRDVEISADPLRVRSGQTTTLTWSADAINTGCTITGPGYSQTVSANSCTVPNGTAVRTVNSQSEFVISCDNGAATDSVIVNVIPEFEEF
ncbi:MAG TPA: PKD domain-containing protein [Candidatus Paceibacterota bacterium]|nr:PKD domain-containing protein [Candidatus Paceibacterota bacterium]